MHQTAPCLGSWNLSAGRGVAVREFPLKSGHGEADYLLFVDGAPIGVVEARPSINRRQRGRSAAAAGQNIAAVRAAILNLIVRVKMQNIAHEPSNRKSTFCTPRRSQNGQHEGPIWSHRLCKKQ